MDQSGRKELEAVSEEFSIMNCGDGYASVSILSTVRMHLLYNDVTYEFSPCLVRCGHHCLHFSSKVMHHSVVGLMYDYWQQRSEGHSSIQE